MLRERHLGDWEGTDWPEYNKLTAAEMAKGIEGATAESVLAAGDMFQRGWVVTPPGGESLDQVKKRGQKFFEVDWESLAVVAVDKYSNTTQ